ALAVLDNPSHNPHFQLCHLIRYCIENELYEFLFCLYQHSPARFQQTISDFRSPGSNPADLRILTFLQQLLAGSTSETDFYFDKSLLIYRFLLSPSTIDDHLVDVDQIVRLMAENLQEIDLILLIFSLSSDRSLNQF